MSTKKGRVGSTFQLSITFSILIGEFMNYLLVPSFESDKCVPLNDYIWKMKTVSMFQRPTTNICTSSGYVSERSGASCIAGEKRVASSLSLSAQEYVHRSLVTHRTFIEGKTVRSNLFSPKVFMQSMIDA